MTKLDKLSAHLICSTEINMVVKHLNRMEVTRKNRSIPIIFKALLDLQVENIAYNLLQF